MFNHRRTFLISFLPATVAIFAVCALCLTSIKSPVEQPEPTVETVPAISIPPISAHHNLKFVFADALLHEPVLPTTSAETAPPPSEPEVTEPLVTEPPHVHTYTKNVVAPSPAYRGYTEHVCECGSSYRNNYTNRTLSAVKGVSFNLSDIPAQMQDSDVLNSLAYLGVNVQQLKDEGILFRLNSIGSRTPQYARSPVPYSRGGKGSGQQTIADPSTPTGYAPDIATFRKTGLDCVDLAAYYLTNYLPNIKGADISVLETMCRKYEGRFGRCYDHMDFWPTACKDLAEQGLIERYTYAVGEDYSDVFSKITPGTLIQMGNRKDATKHYAIYAGSFGGNHYMIHSGNPNRGPEISLITYQWGDTAEDQHSWPLAFYEFHFPVANA